MTKFKKYLRAKGVKLSCDYEALPYKDLETIKTSATDGCVIATAYFNTLGPWSVAYDKHGECIEFCPDVGDLDLLKLYYGLEYTTWLYDMGYTSSETRIEVMRFMYYNDAEVRMAFRHMRAGIMKKRTFHKWLKKCYLRYMSISDQ